VKGVDIGFVRNAKKSRKVKREDLVRIFLYSTDSFSSESETLRLQGRKKRNKKRSVDLRSSGFSYFEIPLPIRTPETPLLLYRE